MNDGMAVDVVDGSQDTLLQFLFGGDADVPQDRTSKLRKEALDKVEPGAVLGREGECEAPFRLPCQPGFGLLRDVGGMIVEDQLDRGFGRVSRIEKLEEFHKLAAAVAILD